MPVPRAGISVSSRFSGILAQDPPLSALRLEGAEARELRFTRLIFIASFSGPETGQGFHENNRIRMSSALECLAGSD